MRFASPYLSPYAVVDITGRDPPYALMDLLLTSAGSGKLSSTRAHESQPSSLGLRY